MCGAVRLDVTVETGQACEGKDFKMLCMELRQKINENEVQTLPGKERIGRSLSFCWGEQ